MNTSAVKNVSNRTGNTVKSGYNTVKNTAQHTYRRFQSSSTFMKVVTVLFILFIVIILILWLMHLYNTSQYQSKQSPFIISQPINAFSRNDNPVVRKRVPYPTDGLTFTYSFWMYIADWNYNFGKWKNILIKGNNDRRAPGLWLYPKTNSLHARINTHADYNEGCDIRNIPLQKWVHVVYILNNRSVDIYINGKLERSCVLRGVPVLNNDPVNVATDGGFFGQLSAMQYFTRALSPLEVADIYSRGPYMPKQYNINILNQNNGQNNGQTYEQDIENDWNQE